MMKKLVYLSLLVAIAVSCTDNTNTYKIQGSIEGLDNQNVYLQGATDEGYQTIDSMKSESGDFVFSGEIDVPTRHKITFDNLDAEISLFTEASEIQIEGHIDSLKKTTVKGSEAQKVFEKYQKRLNQLKEQQKNIYYKYQEAKKQGNKDSVKLYENQYRKLDSIRNSYSDNFIKKHPSSVVSAYIANRIAYNYDLEKLKKTVNNFDPSIEPSYFVQRLKEQIDKLESTQVGKKAPGFTMKNTEGKPVSLSDFRGQYVLLDFWAAWCGPCRKENPNVVEAYQKYKDEGFTVLGVSLDRNKENWLKAIEKDNLTWTHLSDLKGWDNKASNKYGVRSIPQNYLLDEKGVIVAKNLRGEDLHNKLEEIF